MSRSYRKTPIWKGDDGHKWDKKQSNRMYRRFVKEMISHERFDDIHNNNKVFWDRWSWSPDYEVHFFGKEISDWYKKLLRK